MFFRSKESKAPGFTVSMYMVVVLPWICFKLFFELNIFVLLKKCFSVANNISIYY